MLRDKPKSTAQLNLLPHLLPARDRQHSSTCCRTCCLRAAMLLAMLSFAVAAAAQPPATGAICNGVDTSGRAETLLQGKHLYVYDYEWPGFAAKDASAPYGWVGFDIDLLSAIAAILDFTFEVHEMVSLEGESWDEMLHRLTPQGDLILSYWGRTPEKLSTLTMLAGHIDYSPILAIRKNAPEEVALLDKITSFLRPFDWGCWVALIAMIVGSGVVDYLLEREEGGTLGSSICKRTRAHAHLHTRICTRASAHAHLHTRICTVLRTRALTVRWLPARTDEYFSGTLWGGFQDPRSKLSAFYQVGRHALSLHSHCCTHTAAHTHTHTHTHTYTYIRTPLIRSFILIYLTSYISDLTPPLTHSPPHTHR